MNKNSRNEESMIDELTWQLLVDGELSQPQLRELVAMCDAHPHLWKQCAVAFLEEQALQQELKQLMHSHRSSLSGGNGAHEPMPTVPSPVFIASIEQPATVAATVTPGANDGVQTPNAVNRSSFLSFKTLDWAALAASLIVAFFIGLKSAPRDNLVIDSESNSSPMAATGTGSSTQSQFAKAIPSNRGNAAASDSKLIQSGTPITPDEAWTLALDQSDKFVPLDSQLPPQLAELKNRGLVDIEATDGFVPVTLSNGNAAVVPVQKYQVKPVRFAY